MRLIDADALMKRVCEKECGPHFNIDLCDLDDDSTDTRCVFREYVKAEPTIEAEPVRHGRWIQTTLKGYYECSACEYEHTSNPDQRFCSYCGAKMYQTGGTISKERFAEIMRGADNDS